jgi:hypothetical protein
MDEIDERLWNGELASLVRTKDMALVLYRLPQARTCQVVVVAPLTRLDKDKGICSQPADQMPASLFLRQELFEVLGNGFRH